MKNPKIKKALEAIYEAQLSLDAACRELCSADLGDCYGRSCKMSEAVKAHWHHVWNEAVLAEKNAKEVTP